MKTTTRLNLKGHEKKALQALKDGLTDRFPEAEIILYGSKARGNSKTFSDIDVLVLLGREINNSLEEVVFGMAYDVELKYDVVFGILVESKVFWDSDLAHAMPIHWNIDREGIV